MSAAIVPGPAVPMLRDRSASGGRMGASSSRAPRRFLLGAAVVGVAVGLFVGLAPHPGHRDIAGIGGRPAGPGPASAGAVQQGFAANF